MPSNFLAIVADFQPTNQLAFSNAVASELRPRVLQVGLLQLPGLICPSGRIRKANLQLQFHDTVRFFLTGGVNQRKQVLAVPLRDWYIACCDALMSWTSGLEWISLCGAGWWGGCLPVM